MADPSDSQDSASPSPDWYQEQWSVLCDVLDVSDPAAVLPEVQALRKQAPGTATASEEVKDAFRDMRDQLEALRGRNAELLDRLEATSETPASSSDGLHPKTESLLEQLGVSSLDQAEERVQSLTQQNDHLYREKEILAEAGLMSAKEALAEIDRLQEECDRQEETSASSETSSSPVPDILGVHTAEEARELEHTVRRMSETLDTLQEQRHTLTEELGVDQPAAVLDLVRSMEAQLSALYDERSGQQAPDGLPAEIGDVLGIATVEEAEDLASRVRSMSTRLQEVLAQQRTLTEAGYDAETAVLMIDSMKQQLAALYDEQETAQAAASTVSSSDEALLGAVSELLGLDSPEDVRRLSQTVRRMGEQLDALQERQQPLSEAGLSAEDALLMLRNMEEQLRALYQEQEERSSALTEQIRALGDHLGTSLPDGTAPAPALDRLREQAETLLVEARGESPEGRPPGDLAEAVDVLASSAQAAHDAADELASIREALGISDSNEAEQLAALSRNMTEQLETLHAERERLHDVGVTSVDGAVRMIENMSTQLDELYQEQESLRDRPSPTKVGQQDTFEQLATMYSEQEKLERALGVSEADRIIEMFETLTDQLDALYADRDADQPGEPPAHATGDAAPLPEHDRTTVSVSDEPPAPPSGDETMASMQAQLESLYAEKEVLLDRGLTDAQTAVDQIDDLEQQVQSLRTERDQCHEQFDRLASALGTTDVDAIVEMAQPSPGEPAAEASPPASVSDASASDSSVSDDVPALLPEETLERLDEMSEADLDALEVGLLRLDDDGHITFVNEAGRALPGLDKDAPPDDLVGSSLFLQVPATTNALFLQPFREGVETGSIDTRFPYAFVSSDHSPMPFHVHLYRAGPSRANWLLLRAA